MPAARAVSIASEAVKIMIRASASAFTAIGLSGVTKIPSSIPALHDATRTPSSAPAAASTTLSISSRRTIWRRLAPTARRSASSRCRAAPRAIKQVGDVGGDDEQHAGSDGHQNQQRIAHRVAQAGSTARGVVHRELTGEETARRVRRRARKGGVRGLLFQDRPVQGQDARLRLRGAEPGLSRAYTCTHRNRRPSNWSHDGPNFGCIVTGT